MNTDDKNIPPLEHTFYICEIRRKIKLNPAGEHIGRCSLSKYTVCAVDTIIQLKLNH